MTQIQPTDFILVDAFGFDYAHREAKRIRSIRIEAGEEWSLKVLSIQYIKTRTNNLLGINIDWDIQWTEGLDGQLTTGVAIPLDKFDDVPLMLILLK